MPTPEKNEKFRNLIKEVKLNFAHSRKEYDALNARTAFYSGEATDLPFPIKSKLGHTFFRQRSSTTAWKNRPYSNTDSGIYDYMFRTTGASGLKSYTRQQKKLLSKSISEQKAIIKSLRAAGIQTPSAQENIASRMLGVRYLKDQLSGRSFTGTGIFAPGRNGPHLRLAGFHAGTPEIETSVEGLNSLRWFKSMQPAREEIDFDELDRASTAKSISKSVYGKFSFLASTRNKYIKENFPTNDYGAGKKAGGLGSLYWLTSNNPLGKIDLELLEAQHPARDWFGEMGDYTAKQAKKEFYLRKHLAIVNSVNALNEDVRIKFQRSIGVSPVMPTTWQVDIHKRLDMLEAAGDRFGKGQRRLESEYGIDDIDFLFKRNIGRHLAGLPFDVQKGLKSSPDAKGLYKVNFQAINKAYKYALESNPRLTAYEFKRSVALDTSHLMDRVYKFMGRRNLIDINQPYLAYYLTPEQEGIWNKYSKFAEGRGIKSVVTGSRLAEDLRDGASKRQLRIYGITDKETLLERIGSGAKMTAREELLSMFSGMSPFRKPDGTPLTGPSTVLHTLGHRAARVTRALLRGGRYLGGSIGSWRANTHSDLLDISAIKGLSASDEAKLIGNMKQGGFDFILDKDSVVRNLFGLTKSAKQEAQDFWSTPKGRIALADKTARGVQSVLTKLENVGYRLNPLDKNASAEEKAAYYAQKKLTPLFESSDIAVGPARKVAQNVISRIRSSKLSHLLDLENENIPGALPPGERLISTIASAIQQEAVMKPSVVTAPRLTSVTDTIGKGAGLEYYWGLEDYWRALVPEAIKDYADTSVSIFLSEIRPGQRTARNIARKREAILRAFRQPATLGGLHQQNIADLHSIRTLLASNTPEQIAELSKLKKIKDFDRIARLQDNLNRELNLIANLTNIDKERKYIRSKIQREVIESFERIKRGGASDPYTDMTISEKKALKLMDYGRAQKTLSLDHQIKREGSVAALGDFTADAVRENLPGRQTNMSEQEIGQAFRRISTILKETGEFKFPIRTTASGVSEWASITPGPTKSSYRISAAHMDPSMISERLIAGAEFKVSLPGQKETYTMAQAPESTKAFWMGSGRFSEEDADAALAAEKLDMSAVQKISAQISNQPTDAELEKFGSTAGVQEATITEYKDRLSAGEMLEDVNASVQSRPPKQSGIAGFGFPEDAFKQHAAIDTSITGGQKGVHFLLPNEHGPRLESPISKMIEPTGIDIMSTGRQALADVVDIAGTIKTELTEDVGVRLNQTLGSSIAAAPEFLRGNYKKIGAIAGAIAGVGILGSMMATPAVPAMAPMQGNFPNGGPVAMPAPPSPFQTTARIPSPSYRRANDRITIGDPAGTLNPVSIPSLVGNASSIRVSISDETERYGRIDKAYRNRPVGDR